MKLKSISPLRIFPDNWYDNCLFNNFYNNSTFPLNVDIGSGKGRFIFGRSKNYPNENFLGIERQLGRVNKSSKKCEMNQRKNVKFLRIEGLYAVKYLIPKNYISNYYLFFPDPWPKERHYQNRLFNELFVSSIHKTLIINGCFHIKTDHHNYFKEIYNTLLMNRKFKEIKSLSLEENEKTDFERLFYNKKIYSCSFTKLVD